MSDDWQFFPCTIDGDEASIFVNIAAAKTIDEDAPSLLVRVRLVYKATYPNGLPMQTDYEAACSIEDALQDFADESNDLYAGRITAAGRRDFYFYTFTTPQAWGDRVGKIELESGYDLGVDVMDDPEHRTYWDELWPTEDDWQVISDLRVIFNLKELGDDGSQPRDVEHWAYFPDEQAAREFMNWAVSDRFSQSEDAPIPIDDGRYCARLRHQGDIDIHNISSHTIALRRKAAELGGDYGGWEVKVMKASDEET